MPVPLPVVPLRRLTRARRMMLAVVAILAATPALAQSSDTRKNDNSCAQYGAGFQRVPGSTSCVRTGATVRTDVFGGSAPGSAGNQFNGTPSVSSGTTSQSSDPWKSTR